MKILTVIDDSKFSGDVLQAVIAQFRPEHIEVRVLHVLQPSAPAPPANGSIGTGEGALPVMDEVKREAKRRKVELLILPTEEAMELLNQHATSTNAILHVTC